MNKINVKDEFIASLNHELRNPLNVMLCNLDLLKKSLKYDKHSINEIKKSITFRGGSFRSDK